MKIEEYYRENYPEGKPWEDLSKDDRRAVKRERRQKNWQNIKETLEDITDVLDFIMTIFSTRR